MLPPSFIWHSELPDASQLQTGIDLALQANAQSLLLLSCADNNYDEAQVNSLLSTLNIPVFGGIYPKLIWQKQALNTGVIVVGFAVKLTLHTFEQVSSIAESANFEVEDIVQTFPDLLQQHSSLIFYDGLTYGVEDYIDSLYESIGGSLTVAGGGAGSLTFEQKPCLYTNQGLIMDALMLVFLPFSINTGVSHGWQKLDGPYLVTESRGHFVTSLNYSNAEQFYKNKIQGLSGHRFDSEDFFEIAKHFPLGVEGRGGDILVRDPIKVENGELVCVGNVPENTMIYLLQGEVNSLIEAVNYATCQAVSQGEGHHVMVFDCVSRILYMESDFAKELTAVNDAVKSTQFVFGVLSLGEIANSLSNEIRLLNKSTVIAQY